MASLQTKPEKINDKSLSKITTLFMDEKLLDPVTSTHWTFNDPDLEDNLM